MSRYLALAALSLFALAACDDNGTEPQQQGRLRVVQAISNVASADVLFGTATAKAALVYKGVYTDASRAAGSTTVKVRKAGAPADLVSVPVPVEASKGYTVVAFGTDSTPQHLLLVDDVSVPAEGKAKVRVIHAAAGAAAVDVYVVKAVADLATATAVKSGLTEKTATDYAVVAANPTYVVILTQPGTKTPVLTVPNVPLTAGKVYTVVAVEKSGGGSPLESVVFQDR